jgi:DNA-binding beta-propeller fold protein YncE
MRKTLLAGLLATAFAGLATPVLADVPLEIELLGTYTTGLADLGEETSSGETVALRGDRMYVTNAKDVSLDIVDVSNPVAPVLVKRVDLKAYGSSANSVDVSARNLIAVAIAAPKKTDPGMVVFLTPAGQVIRSAKVGAGPDMVVFTPKGDRLLVANEGEPDCYGEGCTDPEGSVSVIDVNPMKPQLRVHTIGFGDVALPAGVRVFGPNASPAQDLEPEYITVDQEGETAWVTLQENNAIARLDLRRMKVSAVYPLGYKDHGVAGNGLDVTDKDGKIDIKPVSRLYGMYQPDAIARFEVHGHPYLITANEGDARDYGGFAEEMRAKDLAAANPGLADIADVGNKNGLGRLTVTAAAPDFNNLYVFGARSFSIWDGRNGSQVWDSGDQLEQITAQWLPAYFNSNNSKNDFDSRSDNKGPEPEGVAVGRIGDKQYAFVGLERIGGVMVYDVTNPHAPSFKDYLYTRDFTQPAMLDSGPEILRFVRGRQSPTGRPMLVVANEITGTVNLWSLTGQRDRDDD